MSGPSALRAFFAGKPRGRSPLEDIAAENGLRFDKRGTDAPIPQWPSLGASLVNADSRTHEILNMAWGGHRGRRFAAFDLAEHVNPSDGSSYTNWFSCVVLVLEANLPRLMLDRENALTRLLDKLPLGGGFNSGVKEFDDRFMVIAQPRAFAGEVLDPGMVQWLLTQEFPARFELEGSTLLLKADAFRGANARRYWDEMIELAHGFYDRIPSGVLERYPDAARLQDEAEKEGIPRTYQVGEAPKVDPRSKGIFGAAAGVAKVAKPAPGVEPVTLREVQRRLLGIWGYGITTGTDDEQIVIAWAARVAGENKEYRYRAVRISLDAAQQRATGSLFHADTTERLIPGNQLVRSAEWTFGPPMGDERYEVAEWLGGDGSGATGPYTFSWWALVEAVVEAVTGAGWAYKPKVVRGWPG